MERTEVKTLVEVLNLNQPSEWVLTPDGAYFLDEGTFTFTLQRIDVKTQLYPYDTKYLLSVHSSSDSTSPIEQVVERNDDPEKPLKSLYDKVSGAVNKRVSSQREEAIARFRRTYLEE